MTTVFNTSFVANSAGNTGYSYRQVVPSISTGGTHVRVTFNSTTGGTYSAGHASIGIQQSGMATTTAPVELTFSGESGFNISSGEIVSDWAALNTSTGQSLIVIIDPTTSNMPRNGAGNSGWDSYPNQVNTWNIQSPSGTWVSFSPVYGFSKVEVETQGPPPPVGPLLTASGIPSCGRLTPIPAQTKMTDDVVSSTLAYSPENGDTCVLIDANAIRHTMVFASDCYGPSITLGSWIADGLYDCYMAYNGGVPQFGLGPRWNPNPVDDTLCQCVRVNAVPFTLTVSSTQTLDVPQYQGTLLGTVSIVGGQITFHRKMGKSRRCDIWNLHNQEDFTLCVTDPTTSPFYVNDNGDLSGGSSPSTTPHPIANDATWNASILSGRNLGQRPQLIGTSNTRLLHGAGQQTTNTAWSLGIGWNSTSVLAGGTVFQGTLGTDLPAINATRNIEFYPSEYDAGTQHAWAVPPSFQGSATAYLLYWGIWGYLQYWVDSGDIMMSVRFKY